MPEERPRAACKALTLFLVLGLAFGSVLTAAVAYALPASTYASNISLREHVESTTVLGKFLLNCTWVIFLMLGVLVGRLHTWWKEEKILQGGLEEWRRWRGRG